MRKASAFCPSYITGIFTIGKNDAAGAGFTIDSGMTTTVGESRGMTKIIINGSESAAPVSKAVLRKFSTLGKVGVVEIRHETPLPIGFGLGMSAAGALSLSLALNELLGLGMKREECVKIAHDSDVECGTGLSGADASAIGGILVRRRIGEEVVRLPFEERQISLAFFSPMRNATVLKSKEWTSRVNAAGEAALDGVFAKKTWDSLVLESRKFATASLLASWCSAEMAKNPRASMAMLGQTLFSDAPMEIPGVPGRMNANVCGEGAKAL